MTNQKKLVRDAVVSVVMIGASFACGWWSHEYKHNKTRRMSFDFSKPFVIPRTHESFGLRPTPDTAPYRAGDRIDVLVRVDERMEPIILDAIVTHKTKANFGLLVPRGGRDVFLHALNHQMPIAYRRSIVVSDVILLENYEG